jgi:transcriptional regulator with XRE-family HTH domain
MMTTVDDAPTIDEQIGARLRAARLQAVLTQEELAQALGVDRSTVAKWEAGQRGMTVENLLRTAAILETPPAQLLAGTEGEKPAARTLSEVIVEQQTVQTIAQTLAQRPDAIPVVIAALKRWVQSGQAAEDAPNTEHTGVGSAVRTIMRQLHEVDITKMTPLDALQLLDALQQLAYQSSSTIEPLQS